MAKLLIVDDDIRLRKLVRTYGEVEHYECEEAADGQIGRASCRERV